MDQVYQVMYGPIQDKLKYAGTVWLGLSLLANFGQGGLGGFIGLLAILAVINSSLYLLRLTLIFAPLSLIVAIAVFLKAGKGWAWIFLHLLLFLVQAVTILWAYQYHQELAGQDGYDVPRDGDQGQGRGQPTHSDPFQAYVPPQGQQSTIYAPEPRQQQAEQPRPAQSQPPQGRKEEGTKGENLL